jgi:hypothetical protein
LSKEAGSGAGVGNGSGMAATKAKRGWTLVTTATKDKKDENMVVVSYFHTLSSFSFG